MQVVYKDEYVSIVLMKGFNKAWLEFIWKNLNIPLKPNLIDAHTKAIEVAVSNSCKTYIARIENAKEGSKLSDDCIKWWGRIWVKHLVKKGIRRIITVHNQKSPIANLNAKDWKNLSEEVGISGYDCKDYTESWKGIV